MSIELLDEDEDADSKEQKKKHEDFLLAEYNNIAAAYFNTVTTIAAFFRNYLVVVGLPIPILGFVLTQLTKSDATFSLPPGLAFMVLVFGAAIGCLGLGLMLYVVNLRLDALLYARTVNGIRKYFYDKSPEEYHSELQMRVLPRSVTQPRYWEWRYFGPVIVVFAILNTLYPFTAITWFVIPHCGQSFFNAWYYTIVIPACFFLFHLVSYWYLVHRRETAYLRKFIIGADIDGVLNTHRDTFCTMLFTLLHKQNIFAHQITKIPVHDCPGLGVTEADEHAIFNHPSYWRALQPTDRVAEVIKKLRNVFGFQIILFTHRPWPEPKTFPRGREEEYREIWCREFLSFWGSSIGPGVIRTLTDQWLMQHGIVYDKLVVEKGNVHTADPSVRTRNRFTLSERWEIRIFVEDDLFKAIKIANICEVVFLMDHPYNRTDNLPRNVIRVSGWEDIYEYIRQKL